MLIKTLSSGHRFAPVLALDLDGTVRRSKNGEFINKPEDVEIIPGVEPIVWRWKNAGYVVAGITNQGGVAHGFMEINDVLFNIQQTVMLCGRHLELNLPMFDIISASYFDPTGKIEPFCHRSLARKPDIGMLALIERDLLNDSSIVVDWDNSLMVGDRPEDEECAKRAGIAFKWAKDFFDPAQQDGIEVEF